MNLEGQLREQVKEASESSSQWEQLRSQMQQVNQQVGSLGTSVLGTQQLALGTELGVSNLGNAFSLTNASGTIITGSDSPVFSRDIKLTGQNFGNSKGKIYLSYGLPFAGAPSINEPAAGLQIDESIVSWQDTNLTLHLSVPMLQKIEAEEPPVVFSGAQVAVGGANWPTSPSVYYYLVIQTATGETSNAWGLSQGPNLVGN